MVGTCFDLIINFTSVMFHLAWCQNGSSTGEACPVIPNEDDRALMRLHICPSCSKGKVGNLVVVYPSEVNEIVLLLDDSPVISPQAAVGTTIYQCPPSSVGSVGGAKD